jgi:hypothetical protein
MAKNKSQTTLINEKIAELGYLLENVHFDNGCWWHPERGWWANYREWYKLENIDQHGNDYYLGADYDEAIKNLESGSIRFEDGDGEWSTYTHPIPEKLPSIFPDVARPVPSQQNS